MDGGGMVWWWGCLGWIVGDMVGVNMDDGWVLFWVYDAGRMDVWLGYGMDGVMDVYGVRVDGCVLCCVLVAWCGA